MGIADTQPSNRNLLHTTSFQVVFSKIPTVTYFAQAVNIPGVNLGETRFPTPLLDIPAPGDKLVYEPLSIQFLVDEDLASFKEMYNWLKGLGFPTTTDEYKNLLDDSDSQRPGVGDTVSNAMLTFLTNALNNNIQLQFHDVFPINLSSLQMNAAEGTAAPLVADVSLMFSFYEWM